MPLTIIPQKSDYGTSYTLLTLLIVVLGGVNPNGGRGKVMGVVMSIILLQLVSSAFNILRVNAFVKTFAWGLILILVTTATYLRRLRRKREINWNREEYFTSKKIKKNGEIMRTIHAQKLSKEAFSPYGQYYNLMSPEGYIWTVFPTEF